MKSTQLSNNVIKNNTILFFPNLFLNQKQKLTRVKFHAWQIIYNNEESYRQTRNEIFDEQPYFFKTNNKKPLIIDGGANIGLASLYFLEKYPDAEILCFEPDPNAAKILQKNIILNNLSVNITLNRCALSDKNSTAKFYGQLFGDSPDARGNSLIKDWGIQRENSTKIMVSTVCLSEYIKNKKVDFLKLDIEGAEYKVIKNLADKNKLKNILQLSIEVHNIKTIDNGKTHLKIIDLLKKNNFTYQLSFQDVKNILPKETLKWGREMSPELCIIKAINKAYKLENNSTLKVEANSLR